MLQPCQRRQCLLQNVVARFPQRRRNKANTTGVVIEACIDQRGRNVSLLRLLFGALSVSTPISFWLKQGHSSLYFAGLASEKREGFSTRNFYKPPAPIDAGLMYIYT